MNSFVTELSEEEQLAAVDHMVRMFRHLFVTDALACSSRFCELISGEYQKGYQHLVSLPPGNQEYLVFLRRTMFPLIHEWLMICSYYRFSRPSYTALAYMAGRLRVSINALVTFLEFFSNPTTRCRTRGFDLAYTFKELIGVDVTNSLLITEPLETGLQPALLVMLRHPYTPVEFKTPHVHKTLQDAGFKLMKVAKIETHQLQDHLGGIDFRELSGTPSKIRVISLLHRLFRREQRWDFQHFYEIGMTATHPIDINQRNPDLVTI